MNLANSNAEAKLKNTDTAALASGHGPLNNGASQPIERCQLRLSASLATLHSASISGISENLRYIGEGEAGVDHCGSQPDLIRP
jgi:hypothetical protein